MSEVYVVDHPLVQAKLTKMRDETTPYSEFRKLLNEITLVLTMEATRNLATVNVPVKTPICEAEFPTLKNHAITVVPILRAGLGMVDAFLELVPFARVGHIGLERDEVTKLPREYYFKMPSNVADSKVYVVDPMLATGGSSVDAIAFLKEHGCTDITLINLVGAPKGIQAMQEAHPDVDIYIAAIDERLNENAYIVPGLGDAGDRFFGTD